MCNVIDTVEIPRAFLVVHVLPLTANYFQRVALVKQLAGFTAITNMRRWIKVSFVGVLYHDTDVNHESEYFGACIFQFSPVDVGQ